MPYSGTSAQRLVELINLDNETDLVLSEDFNFGEVLELDDPKYNTVIKLNPIDTDTYKTTVVRYNRLPLDRLAEQLESQDPIEVESLPISTHDILDEVNSLITSVLLPEDIILEDITEVDEEGYYELVTASSSLAWIPGTRLEIKLNVGAVEDPEDIPEIISATQEEDGEGNITFTIQTDSPQPYSLEVDHSREDILPQFTIYASEENVWGDEDSEVMADQLSVLAEFDANEGTWRLTFIKDGLAYEELKDTGITLKLVVKDTDGRESGSMMDGSYHTVTWEV